MAEHDSGDRELNHISINSSCKSVNFNTHTHIRMHTHTHTNKSTVSWRIRKQTAGIPSHIHLVNLIYLIKTMDWKTEGVPWTQDCCITAGGSFSASSLILLDSFYSPIFLSEPVWLFYCEHFRKTEKGKRSWQFFFRHLCDNKQNIHRLKHTLGWSEIHLVALTKTLKFNERKYKLRWQIIFLKVDSTRKCRPIWASLNML